MKQVLSQQEIDSLLNALDTGQLDTKMLEEENEDKVKSYDFRRPIKLSKEYMNSLHMIFENFSKIAGNLISSQVHSTVDITLGAIEQISFDEFIRSIPKVTLMGIFQSKPLGGIQVMEINPQFCMQVVELVCGGAEVVQKYVANEKQEFTDIELGILTETVELMLQSLESAWQEVVEIETKLDHLETNPQLVQSMSPTEPVILTSFTIEALGCKSFINVCIPFVSLENIMDKLSFRSWFDFEKEEKHGDRQLIEDRLMSSTVEVKVNLGKSIITVDDFLGVEKGDVLELDVKITDPLKMYVEDQLHYLVRPGQRDGRMAVEVLEYIEEDVE